MTIEQLLAGARDVKRGRRNKERHSYLGVGYTIWQGPTWSGWFAEIDGGQGFGTAEDRESAIQLAEGHIQEEAPCLSL